MSNNNKVASKTYVLLDSTRPTAPIYTQLSQTERVRHNVRKRAAAYLQVTFTDGEGQNKTARLKLNSNSIWLKDQIDSGIPANAKFTNAERNAVRFVNGTLTTNLKVVQDFLEAIPQFDQFNGIDTQGIRPLYRLDDVEARIKDQNNTLKTRVRAANIVMGLNLKKAQDLLLLINGSFYVCPTELEPCQNELADLIDESESALQEILKLGEQTEVASNTDDEVDILMGRLLSAGIVSLDAVANQISKKRDDGWVSLKDMSSDLSQDQRLQYFKDFVTSRAGQPVLEDLRREAEKLDRPVSVSATDTKPSTQTVAPANTTKVIKGKSNVAGRRKAKKKPRAKFQKQN